MKRSIPAEFITADAVKSVLRCNSNEQIMDSLTSETIVDMCKVLTGTYTGGTGSALLCMRINDWNQADKLCSTNLMDSLTERLVVYAGTVLLQVLDGDRLVYCSIIDTKGDMDYQTDNLGSGKSDDGKYYLSLCVYREDSEYAEKWLARAITYDGVNVEVENVVDWTGSEEVPCYVYSKGKQCFVPYYML